MTRYRVIVADNFHYRDEAESYVKGEYGSLDEALAVCRKIVDDFLLDALKPGMTAEELYRHYTAFGEDPYIIGAPFSAWRYAESRSRELCG